jgi:hypothetical protein
MGTIPGPTPLQLQGAGGTFPKLAFPNVPLATPLLDFDVPSTDFSDRFYTSAKRAAGERVKSILQQRLSDIFVPKFLTSGATLAVAEHVVANLAPNAGAAAVEQARPRVTQAFVPGDLVLIAP